MPVEKPGEPREERSARSMVVDAVLGRRPATPDTPEEAAKRKRIEEEIAYARSRGLEVAIPQD